MPKRICELIAAKSITKSAYRSYCPNCAEPYYRDKENGSNRKVHCPECGKQGCTFCVTMTETGTCCCAPESP